MHQIARNLFSLALVSTMILSGMVQWMPSFGANMMRDSGIPPVHLSLGHGDHAHDSMLPEKKAGAPPEAGYGERCQQPSIGCDCPGCLGYLDAHSFTLPAIIATPPQFQKFNAYADSLIVSFPDLYFAPLTPPPRS